MKARTGMPPIPATSGTVDRSTGMKRAIATLGMPKRWKNTSAPSTSFGREENGQIPRIRSP
jgi:hypothetical protein